MDGGESWKCPRLIHRAVVPLMMMMMMTPRFHYKRLAVKADGTDSR
jgi:hypothetical protein